MSQSIRAKFVCYNVETFEGTSAGARVTMGAVCRGVENSMWAQATPSATITMTVKSDAEFVAGQEYDVLFTPSAKPEPGDGHPLVQAVTMSNSIVCEACGMHVGYTARGIEQYPHVKQYVDERGLMVENVAKHDEVYALRE